MCSRSITPRPIRPDQTAVMPDSRPIFLSPSLTSTTFFWRSEVMERHVARCGIGLVLMLVAAEMGWTQSAATETLLQQSLGAQVGTAGLPSDLVIEGQLIDASGTRPLRMQVKGKD